MKLIIGIIIGFIISYPFWKRKFGRKYSNLRNWISYNNSYINKWMQIIEHRHKTDKNKKEKTNKFVKGS